MICRATSDDGVEDSTKSVSVRVISPRHTFCGVAEQNVRGLFNDRGTVFLCDSCLSIFAHAGHLQQHVQACRNAFWIPGDEVYRDEEHRFCVFALDGRKPQCVALARRICLLSKLFLVDKVTLDDVHFFSFMALFEVDDEGFHFVGYFSKEWTSSTSCVNTLSCVMVLPPFRSKGYGGFLVRLSYEMARVEGIVGTPERPLSTSGNALFRRVWREEVLFAVFALEERGIPITIGELSKASSLIIEDVLVALQDLDVLFSVGKQGPLLVVNVSEKTRLLQRRLAAEKLYWTSAPS
ncbi:acetyltransferase, putative [Leishmania panamensis]|uniref:histone acetyltransferase n=1 Tax=Leishmania panamensis TaxID=5679 RepID=A0A088S369_LEIPA|nr:acetyltransferase, putative [Leishmania panamensis]AIO02848.1 acetyltransferase, putative [Leishmania panamensis]